MVEEVSPIIYKKLLLPNIPEDENQPDEEEDVDQEDDIEEENLITTTTKQNPKSKKKLNEPRLFYDQASKQMIYVGKTGIKIYNKNVSRLKAQIPLCLNSGKIFKIAVDKQITYMLIFLRKEESRIIYIVSLKNGAVIQSITGNLNQLLGMFFIFNTQSLNIKKENETYFALVYQDKIYYYKITKFDKPDTLDQVEFINEVNYPGYIKKFIYNPKFMILTVQRLDKDEVFDFYNLSIPKYYSKFFTFVLPSKNNTSSQNNANNNQIDNAPVVPSFFDKMVNYFNGGSAANDNLSKEPIINNKENYKENHFFLEAVYTDLFFIYLNYDIGYIQFFKVKNLYNIYKIYEIQFESNHENTLQFIDNLIIVHNFDKMTSRIIDLKSKSDNRELFHSFPISSNDIINQNIEIEKQNEKEKNNKDYKKVNKISMLTYSNTIFYNQDLRISGTVIQRAVHINDTEDTVDISSPIDYFILYNISFDPLIYYDNCVSKYDALINLTSRKHSREVIINGIYDMVKSNRDIKLIKQIFKSIVEELVRNHLKNSSISKMTKEKEQKGEILMNQLETFREPSEIPIPFHYTIFKKKDIINQMDIYTKLFNLIEANEQHIKPEYAITILLLFGDELKIQGVPLHPQFNHVLVNYLKKVKNFFTQNIYFQYFSFPDSLILAKYLIYEIGLNKDDNTIDEEQKEQAIQHGLDMLLRLRKYYEIFKYFIQSDQLSKAFSFLKKYKNKCQNLKFTEDELLINEVFDSYNQEDEEGGNELVKMIGEYYKQEKDEMEFMDRRDGNSNSFV